MVADTVIINADVRTVDPMTSHATGFAIKDGKFVAVGHSGYIQQEFVGEKTKVVDAKGRTIVPGFVDSHIHAVEGGIDLIGETSVDLFRNNDPKDWLKQISEAAARTSHDGTFVVGGRWDATELRPGARFPTLQELDDVTGDVPLALNDIDYHSLWINSALMKLVGIDETTSNPEGGEISRDKKGKLTGVLKENALFLVTSHEAYLKRPQKNPVVDRLRGVLAHLNSVGITTINDITTQVDVWRTLFDGPPPPMRIGIARWVEGIVARSSRWWDEVQDEKARFNQEAAEVERKQWRQGPQLEFSGIKLFMDGTMMNYTAALEDEYADRPGFYGETVNSEEDITDAVTEAFKREFSVCIHAIGDRSVNIALNAFKNAPNPHNLGRRIEHLELITPDAPSRFAKEGVVASMQPAHCISGSYQFSRIGTERAPYSYAWQKLLTTGVTLAFGSDWPTDVEQPLAHLEYATLRMKGGHPYVPENRVSLDEALYAHTQAGADYLGWGDVIGSISVGKWADFVVLPGTISDVRHDKILSWPIQQTWLAGKIVYEEETEIDIDMDF